MLTGLRERGAEVVDADLDDTASLAAASRGARRVFLHPPLAGAPEQVLRQMRSALDAAVGAGVERVVLATTSALPATDSGVASIESNRAAEGLLAAADVAGVVRRPTLYLGNLTAPWSLPRILSAGELAYPLPDDLAVSWLAPADAAAASVRALTGEPADGLVLTLGGPTPVRGADLAAAIGAASGRPVRYVSQSPEEFATGLAPVLGEQTATGIAALYRYYTGPGAATLAVATAPVWEALGIRTRTVEQWATEQDWN